MFWTILIIVVIAGIGFTMWQAKGNTEKAIEFFASIDVGEIMVRVNESDENRWLAKFYMDHLMTKEYFTDRDIEIMQELLSSLKFSFSINDQKKYTYFLEKSIENHWAT